VLTILSNSAGSLANSRSQGTMIQTRISFKSQTALCGILSSFKKAAYAYTNSEVEQVEAMTIIIGDSKIDEI